jgi:hypothetical protein
MCCIPMVFGSQTEDLRLILSRVDIAWKTNMEPPKIPCPIRTRLIQANAAEFHVGFQADMQYVYVYMIYIGYICIIYI